VDKTQTSQPAFRRAAQAAFTFPTYSGDIFPIFAFQTFRKSRRIALGYGRVRMPDGRIRIAFSVHQDQQGGFA